MTGGNTRGNTTGRYGPTHKSVQTLETVLLPPGWGCLQRPAQTPSYTTTSYRITGLDRASAGGRQARVNEQAQARLAFRSALSRARLSALRRSIARENAIVLMADACISRYWAISSG